LVVGGAKPSRQATNCKAMPPRKKLKLSNAVQVGTVVGSTSAGTNNPLGQQAVAIDEKGNVIVADCVNHCIRLVTPEGTVSTLAGSAEGEKGHKDGVGGDARLQCPRGVAVDEHGNIVVADCVNHCIRLVTPEGTVSTLAGSAKDGGHKDGVGGAARFVYPSGVAIDEHGNIVVADSGSHCIRLVTPEGTVSTLAGLAKHGGHKDGAATEARFAYPHGVAIDEHGNIVVADSDNHCIRLVTPEGTVSTLAGSAEGEEGHKDGVGGDARFDDPRDVAIDEHGNIIVADPNNHCIRLVTPEGTVSTLAGSAEDFGGHKDGAATEARFSYPHGVAISGDGTVFVAEKHAIRQLTSCGLGRGLATPRWPIAPPAVIADFGRLLEDETFADTTFDVMGTRLFAHRAILAVRSDYFRSMLTSTCREAQPGAVISVDETSLLLTSYF